MKGLLKFDLKFDDKIGFQQKVGKNPDPFFQTNPKRVLNTARPSMTQNRPQSALVQSYDGVAAGKIATKPINSKKDTGNFNRSSSTHDVITGQLRATLPAFIKDKNNRVSKIKTFKDSYASYDHLPLGQSYKYVDFND